MPPMPINNQHYEEDSEGSQDEGDEEDEKEGGQKQAQFEGGESDGGNNVQQPISSQPNNVQANGNYEQMNMYNPPMTSVNTTQLLPATANPKKWKRNYDCLTDRDR